MNFTNVETFPPEEKIRLAKILINTVRQWNRGARVKLATAQAELAGAQAAKQEYNRQRDQDNDLDWGAVTRWDTTSQEAAVTRAAEEAALMDRLEAYTIHKFLEEGV